MAERRRPAGPCNWGEFGDEDELGTLNYLTSDAVLAGAASIRTGDRYPLSLPVDLPSRPGWVAPTVRAGGLPTEPGAHGARVQRRLRGVGPAGVHEWDSFVHAGAREDGVDGVFYNGVDTDAVDEDGFAHRNGIDKVARAGIAGRAVLLDVARMVTGGMEGVLDNECRIGPETLRRTIDHQRSPVEPGDIVCLRTGWTEAYLEADTEGRLEIVAPVGGGRIASPGVTPDVAEIAQEQRWAAVAADNPAVEATPMPDVGSAHVTMQRNLGLLFGELFVFGDLARAADADGRWDFFFVAVPLLVPGGMGSPGCAIGIR